MKLIGAAALTLAALLFANIETAEAQGYVGSGCNSCVGNYGVLGSPYALSRVPDPPYFAIHPPVYYSQAVPRTYGYSPYAYPGSVRTPEVQPQPAAKEIRNQHVTPTAKKKTRKMLDLTKAPVQPKKITNPFVVQQQLAEAR